MNDATSVPSGPAKKNWSVGTLTYTTNGLVVLFAWLLWGDFAWNLKERAITPVMQILLKRYDASDFLVGLLVGSLGSALGMLMGPWIGMRSDRHRGRWGRRIPYLLVPTPIAALAMAGLAFGPMLGGGLHDWLGANSPGERICVLIAYSVCWTIFEVASTVSQAVLIGLVNDVVPSAVIGRFFGLFRMVTLLAAIVFNLFLIGRVEEHATWIIIGLAVIYGLGFSLMCLKVREGQYPEPAPLGPEGHPGFLKMVRIYVRECYSSPFYLLVFVALSLGLLAFAPVNTFSLYYARSIGMSMEVYGRYLVLTYLISISLSYFIGILADRFHPLRVGIVAMALYAVLGLAGGWFATNPAVFGVVFVMHGVFSGAYVTGTASLAVRLLPKDRFAQFATAGGVLGSFMFMVLPPLVGLLLDWSGNAYRHTFTMGAALAVVTCFVLLLLLRRWQALGGDRSYVAP